MPKSAMPKSTPLRRIVIILISLLIVGCTSSPRQQAAPSANNYAQAQIPSMQEVRFWGDKPAPYLSNSIARLQRSLANNPEFFHQIDILALSGGAEDGAYGAGFLKGWTESGTRPKFMMVTGVSTGALIAPFAFLGAHYDDAIKRLFTETSRQDIFLLNPVSAFTGGGSIGDVAPLQRILKQEIDAKFIAALARESRRGRMLQIATTNLDAQRPVVWEIGRIAESGHPQAAELIRRIMLASASVPGIFPPVAIDVEINGQQYQELHADGGMTHQIFVYPRELNIGQIEQALGVSPKKNFWLIRNTKLAPQYQVVDTDIGSILERSINTLTKYQGRADVHNIEALAKRDGFAYNLTSVPADFNEPLTDYFDREYMRKLYQRGYRQALSSKPWQDLSQGELTKH